MKDTISRQAAIDIAYKYKADIIAEEIEDLPSVQSEHKRGKWSFIRGNMFECTCCGTPYTTQQLNGLCNYDTGLYVPKFCPNCGADLQEDECGIN